MGKRKYTLCSAIVAVAVGLGSGVCSPGAGAQKETVPPVLAGQQITISGDTEPGTKPGTGYENGREAGHETRHKTEFETEEETVPEHITEHIPKQETVGAPVLRLKLSDDVTVCSSPVIIQRDEHTVQVQFHDENTQSDTMARASPEAEGGPSEYHALNEEGIL